MPQDSLQNAPVTNDQGAVVMDHVSRLYGSFVALREVSLTIAAGASVVLLGENGAGKSTLLKLVAGLTSASYGSVRVLGDAPKNQRGRIAYMSHATMLYDELTGLENLTYFASLNATESLQQVAEQAVAERAVAERAAQALDEVGLDPANTRRVGEYSQGMRQRASLARVLLSTPELLLLDEPFSNLDMGSAASMIDRLLRYCAETDSAGNARTLLLTTHQAELARPLARTTVTLRAGRVDSVVEAAR
jgi:ABC-type multidrug transport system ATPase subunit